VRNIVLMRPVNSIIEFKQIIGRGTRLYDGKYWRLRYALVMSSPSSTPEQHPPLPLAVSGERVEFTCSAGRLSYYSAAPHASQRGTAHGNRPLLLIHSINAAGSAAEMRPLHEHYAGSRAVYSLDLPGFGFSDRSDRPYLPRVMTDAVHALVACIRAEHHGVPVDALALSLGCEFLARAAAESPADYASVALVSPTGFNGKKPRAGPPESLVGSYRARGLLAWRGWSDGLFALLTRPGVIRFFLEKTWGSKQIDEALFEYDVITTRQPGAKHAPLYFLSALLFSADIMRVYEALRPPVWLVHGVRGDFVDYRLKSRFAQAANWSVDVMATGAMPYFEAPEAFFQRYDAFLART
jgi:pimeloyl-ACP methyl ester carboxylesterase